MSGGTARTVLATVVYTQWTQVKAKTAMAYRNTLRLLNVSDKCYACKEIVPLCYEFVQSCYFPLLL